MFLLICTKTTLVSHLFIGEVLPFQKNLLKKNPAFFCPSANSRPAVPKNLQTDKHNKTHQKYSIKFYINKIPLSYSPSGTEKV